MRDHARAMLLFAAAGVVVLAVASASAARAQEADPNSAPNPYRVVDHWANLPEGRVWGQAIGVDIDRDGTSIWVFDRCGTRTCEGSDLAPIQKFDASGHLVASLGSGVNLIGLVLGQRSGGLGTSVAGIRWNHML